MAGREWEICRSVGEERGKTAGVTIHIVVWEFRVRSLGRSYQGCKSLSHSLNSSLDYTEGNRSHTQEAHLKRNDSRSHQQVLSLL